jgi:GntR family transcriptional regulator/MocR family aminotransferase
MPPRAQSSLDLHLSLDGRRHVTGQLYRQIRDAVLDGLLRAGDSLPSTRDLATTLGVSRNTVVLVYERLRAEGLLTSRVGAGTFVRDGIRPRAPAPTATSPLRSRALWADIPEASDMSDMRAEYDFRPGVPDARHFPHGPWRARVSRQLRADTLGTGAHLGPAGEWKLREAIARHIGISRGVRTAPEELFVTSGSQQAIDLAARVLLEPGDVVGVEDPGYPLPRRAFQAHGCRVVGVPVDVDGLVVDAIPSRARLVYVTPSHQYPLGMTMSMARRQALLEWADRSDAAILEDDYDSEFRYGGRPLETLHSLDRSGRVLFVGSFSKVLLPTLRLGFAVIPAPLHGAFGKAKHVTDWHTSAPFQGAAADLIDDGLLAQHIRRMRRVYGERHDRIMAILQRDFSEHVTPVPTAGGLHLSAFLHEREATSDVAIAGRAHERGVALYPLSYHFVDAEPRAGLMLGYGAIPADRIEEGLARVRACL